MILREFIRYGFVNAMSYTGTLLSIYLLVDIMLLNPRKAYLIVYTILYIIIYFANLMFVFNKKGGRRTVTSFLIYSVSFLIFNNIFFNIFYTLGLHYMYAAIVSIVIFAPIKFLLQRKFVFK